MNADSFRRKLVSLILAILLLVPGTLKVSAEHQSDDGALFLFWFELSNDLPRYQHTRVRVENARCYGSFKAGFTCLSPDRSLAIHAPDTVIHEDADHLEAMCGTLAEANENAACLVIIEFAYGPISSSPSIVIHIHADFIDVMLPYP